MRKSIFIVLIASIMVYALIILAYAVVKRINNIDHDSDLLYLVTTAFRDIDNDMYFLDEEASIRLYESFFDGNIHYLHEIDENTEFGKRMLNYLCRKYYDKNYYDVRTFEEFESKIRTVDSNKAFAIYYTDDGYLHVYIPNSYSCPLPFVKGEGIYEKMELRYISND